MTEVQLLSIPNGIIVTVLASAGSSRSKVRGIHGGALKIAVRAAPEKGKANAELETVVAEFFGVSRRNVSVVAGQTARSKKVQIIGIDAAAAQAKIAALQEK